MVLCAKQIHIIQLQLVASKTGLAYSFICWYGMWSTKVRINTRSKPGRDIRATAHIDGWIRGGGHSRSCTIKIASSEKCSWHISINTRNNTKFAKHTTQQKKTSNSNMFKYWNEAQRVILVRQSAHVTHLPVDGYETSKLVHRATLSANALQRQCFNTFVCVCAKRWLICGN